MLYYLELLNQFYSDFFMFLPSDFVIRLWICLRVAFTFVPPTHEFVYVNMEVLPVVSWLLGIVFCLAWFFCSQHSLVFYISLFQLELSRSRTIAQFICCISFWLYLCVLLDYIFISVWKPFSMWFGCQQKKRMVTLFSQMMILLKHSSLTALCLKIWFWWIVLWEILASSIYLVIHSRDWQSETHGFHAWDL